MQLVLCLLRYGWEDSFETRLDGVREMELKQLRKYQILNIISSAMWATAPILTALVPPVMLVFLGTKIKRIGPCSL